MFHVLTLLFVVDVGGVAVVDEGGDEVVDDLLTVLQDDGLPLGDGALHAQDDVGVRPVRNKHTTL